MALPKLDTPIYTLTLPSTNKPLKYRPFLVKEEKILLIAIQENDTNALFDAVKQVIKNCTFETIDVDKLTTYDLDYLFLQIRIKSKGPTVPLAFKCENVVKDKNGEDVACGCVNETDYNLENVKVEGDYQGTKKIIIEEESQTGLVMKAPTFETTKHMQDILSSSSVDGVYKALPQYIDTIFQGETVYDDYTDEELQEWIENLNDSQFQEIQDFFRSIPKLKAIIPVKCLSCGYEEQVVLEGLQNFLE